jgi:hypothetical protein
MHVALFAGGLIPSLIRAVERLAHTPGDVLAERRGQAWCARGLDRTKKPAPSLARNHWSCHLALVRLGCDGSSGELGHQRPWPVRVPFREYSTFCTATYRPLRIGQDLIPLSPLAADNGRGGPPPVV